MSAPDRLAESLRRVNGALNPRLVFLATWEYRVISAEPGPPTKIDCSAVDEETSALLPSQLVGLVLWPGPSGIVAVPQPGTIVQVGFVNGDPSKPRVVGLDPDGTPLMVMGFVSATMQLGDQSAAPITPTAYSVALDTALTVFANAMSVLTTPPLTPIGAAGTILLAALGALPSPATTKVLAT